MILKAKTPEITGEKSYLSAAVSSGATSTALKSVVGLAINDILVMGKPGEEKSELVTITSVTTATKTVGHAALTFGHEVSAPVQVIKYNQVKFYKSATLAGTYTLVATVNIDIDDDETRYDYTAGLTTEFYKVAYYNSVTSTESQKSEPLLGSGYTANSVYTMFEGVRDLVGKIDDEKLYRLFNKGQKLIYGMRDDWYWAKTSVEYTTVAATSEYDLPSDFNVQDKIYYTYDDGVSDAITTELSFQTYREFVKDNSTETDATDQAETYTINETTDKIVFPAKADAGGQVFELHYYKKPTDLDAYTDTTDIALPGALEFWVASKIETSKRNDQQANTYWKDFNAQIENMSNKRTKPVQSFYVRN